MKKLLRNLFDVILCLLFGVFWVGAAAATAVPQTQDNHQTGFEPKVKPTVEIRKTTRSITIDGDLDDPGWRDAVQVSGFSEVEPGDQTKPLVETEVLLTYDDQYLYVAFIAYDDPAKIRASLRDRDEGFADDFVAILLDTYGDATWAYEIFANPYGVQGDGRMASGNEEDMGFDLMYSTDGKITDRGYQVEFAIPFRSLRFPQSTNHTWRVTFARNHPRENRRLYSWATVSRDNPCLLCQLGYLTGLQGITPGRNLEFFPEFISSQSGQLANGDDPESRFENSAVTGDVSLGVKYGIASNLTADLALNPDFSQVEADAAKIDVNTTFALYFQERRPFFQEGSDLFSTPIDAVYTRSINDPSVAAKLTGRFDHLNVAYIGALDEQTPIILPFEEHSNTIGSERALRSYSNILRLKRTFGEESFVGFLATDRRLLQNGSGSLFSTDGTFRFLQNYRFDWQFIASHTGEPDDTSLTSDVDPVQFGDAGYSAAFDGEKFWGHAMYVNFVRQAEHWGFDVDYREFTPTFRAANGFVTSNNRRHINGGTSWTFYPNTKWFERFGVGIRARRAWNYNGEFKENHIGPYIWSRFIGQTFMNLSYRVEKERFQEITFSGLRTWDLFLRSNFSDMISAGGGFAWSREIARNEEPPIIGISRSLFLSLDLKPMDRLIIGTSYNSFNLRHPDDNSSIYKGYVLRNRVNLQITRNLHLRLVTQYNDFNQRIDLDPLLTYRINAFSAIYLGSTHDIQEFEGSSNYTQTSRQYFLKVKYLFQL